MSQRHRQIFAERLDGVLARYAWSSPCPRLPRCRTSPFRLTRNLSGHRPSVSRNTLAPVDACAVFVTTCFSTLPLSRGGGSMMAPLYLARWAILGHLLDHGAYGYP